MTNKKELLYFANVIDNIIAIGDYYEFSNKHRKLVELYNILYGYGLKPEYEYAYTKDDEIIPCIIFEPFWEDEMEDPGIPGIMIVSKENQLYLAATDTLHAFEIAIESKIKDNKYFIGFCDDYDECYNFDIFSTNSVSDMAQYLECLSSLEFMNGGLLIPIRKGLIATYWTKLLDNGRISYDRVKIFKIEKSTMKETKDKYTYQTNNNIDDSDELMLMENLSIIKKIISEISEKYKIR